jgi:hypothetical protein
MPEPEYWLRGPVAGVAPMLQPAAHALLQARADVERAAVGLTPAQLWARPGGAASAGFHLRHLAGSLDRLLTYARGESLSDVQRAYLASEGEPGEPPPDADALLIVADAAIERALAQLSETTGDSLLEHRRVGRQGLPSNVLGLLFHAAEHTARHAGQLITTSMVVRGMATIPAPADD